MREKGYTREELIKSFFNFFKSKNHEQIPNFPLVPENDPTVLFTTAGMHPLVPFLLGENHPLGKRLFNVQKCIRTGDIEKVGNATHHTFFEMLGNWSLGDYFKEEAIKYSFEFLTKVLNLKKERLAVSVFGGDKRESKIPIDYESAKIWKFQGIPEKRIAFVKGGVLESENNWWGPAGNTGPCGPDTEMFYWNSEKIPAPESFEPENSNWIEIWNDVLMQYIKNKKGEYIDAKQKNIDTGMGVERTLALLNNLEDNYLTECFLPIIKKIESLSNKKYVENKKEMRIIADHIKASVFIISDGVMPSNTERGYVLRRLIRRTIRYGRIIGLKNFTPKIAEEIFKIYPDYIQLKRNKKLILENLKKEEEKFNQTLEKGIKVFEKISEKEKKINGKNAFLLYQSYGFPIEITKELALEKKIRLDEKEFEKELQKHQNLSRTTSSGKFKSGLADDSENTKKLHTATHLLNQSLRVVLKRQDIIQKGSNITPERLRFDFNFDRKITNEELKKIEDLVNQKITEKLEVKKQLMPLKEAKKIGASGVFGEKYKENVFVYSIENFSKEICAGPHVNNTCELKRFKIKKEESVASGIRRIKAVLE